MQSHGSEGNLGLISLVFSKFSQNCPSREAMRAIWKTENTSEINP